MKDRKGKFRAPIQAAGGIVLRIDHGLTPHFAIVRSRKLETWGLPKGKLAAGEDAMTAARREVLEETGHRVTVYEFLGTLVYETSTSSRPKVVQFWRMEAAGEPAGALMRDVTAVHWLALEDAIDRLTHLRERVFLEHVGPIALKLAGRPARHALFLGETAGGIRVPGVPLAPAAPDASVPVDGGDAGLAERAGPRTFEQHSAADIPPPEGLKNAHGRGAEDLAEQDPAEQAPDTEEQHPDEKRVVEKSLGGNSLMKKTWSWFRHAALLHRHPLD
jgi:8-oxo-dGTP diphosphatase